MWTALAIPTVTSLVEVMLGTSLLVRLVIPVVAAVVTLWGRWAAVILRAVAASHRGDIYINVYILRLLVETTACVTCRGTAESHHR